MGEPLIIWVSYDGVMGTGTDSDTDDNTVTYEASSAIQLLDILMDITTEDWPTVCGIGVVLNKSHHMVAHVDKYGYDIIDWIIIDLGRITDNDYLDELVGEIWEEMVKRQRRASSKK